jgi:hypothetical protein
LTGGTALSLADRLRDIAAKAKTLWWPVPSTTFEHALLFAEARFLGTSAWAGELAQACQLSRKGCPEACTVVNLLLAGLMLIETRNFMVHGQEPLESEAEDDRRASVKNYETGGSVVIDSRSLEMCFRLFVAGATLVSVVGGLNPRRLDERGQCLPEMEKQKEAKRINCDTTDRDLFLRSGSSAPS